MMFACGVMTPRAYADHDQYSEQLEDVVITSSRAQAKLSQMPVNTTLITQEDIRRTAAQSLDQVLRMIPGFNFSGTPALISDPTGNQTKLRGTGNSKVLVMVDGIPVIDPFYLTTQWFKVPLNNIDHIEIMRGGSSSLWGSMAASGVINIITKTPKDNAGEAVFSGGTQGSNNEYISKNFSMSDDLHFNLTYNRTQTNGYLTVPHEYLWMYPGRRPTHDENNVVRLSGIYHPSDRFEAFLKMGYARQDQDINYSPAYGNNLQNSTDVAGGFTAALSEDSKVSTRAWYQYLSFDKYNGASCLWSNANGTGTCRTAGTALLANPQTAANPYSLYYTQYGNQAYREKGLSAVYSKTFNAYGDGIQVGADARKLTASDAEQYYGTPTSINNTQNLFATAIGAGEQTFQGVFMQGKYSPTESLQLTLSGRYDEWFTNKMNSQLARAGGAASGGANPDTSYYAFNPSAGIHYDWNDNVALRASAYTAFRAPGFNNLLRSFGNSTAFTVANPSLMPEKVKGFEVGTDFRGDKLTLSATYFFNDISDMIATYNVAKNAAAPQPVKNLCGWAGGSTFTNCTGNITYYTNDQTGRAYGLELSGKYILTDTLQMDGMYTFTSTFLTSKSGSVTTPLDTQLAGFAKNVAALGLAWKPDAHWHTYIQAYYVGPMTTAFSAAGDAQKQGANTIVNLSASYTINKHWQLYANVMNLFDRTYQDSTYSYGQPWSQALAMPFTLLTGVRTQF